MTEPKYKFSYINSQPGLVVSADSAEEMKQSIKEIGDLWKQFKRTLEPQADEPMQKAFDLAPETRECKYHSDKETGFSCMMDKKWSKDKTSFYYSHLVNGVHCFGK